MLNTKEKNDTVLLKTTNEIAWQYYLKNEFDSSGRYANNAMALAKKLVGEKGVEVQAIAKKSLARADQIIGNIFFSQGNYTESLKYQLEALRIDEEVNFLRGMASSYMNLSNIYTYLGNYDEALRNQLNGLKIGEQLNDKATMAIAYNNISIIYANQKNYSDALKNQEHALKIRKELGDKLSLANSYSNLGGIYDEQGNYKEALKNQLIALKIAEEISNKKTIMHAYANISADYSGMGKYEEAITWMEKALVLEKELNDKESIKTAYSVLSDIYIYLKDYKKALEYKNLYIDIKDSLLNEATSKQIAEVKTKYETERKEKEIEQQQHTIERQNLNRNYLLAGFILFVIFSVVSFLFYNQKKKNTFLRMVSEIEMKALRAQMNPHFTFNVLNSIQYYISKNEIKSAQQYLTKFSRLIRMILDQSRTSYIPLDQEITMLRLYLELEEMRFEKEFKYFIQVDEGLNPGGVLIPGMMVQPVVENAIKYGVEHKKGEAVITVRFSTRNNTLICIVTDNGIGRLEAEKLKSNLNSHKSASTSIIHERVRDMGFIFNVELTYKTEDLIENGQPAGTRVYIEMPLQLVS